MIAEHVLLLTGVPGIGKTTVVRRVAARLKGRRLGGFYTEEIREYGVRRGFRLVGFDGTERIVAHVDFPKVHRVGKYGVDVEAIDVAADRLGLDPSEIYLIDEIGKMECLSDQFVGGMRALLAGPGPVVATIALHGSGFIEEVKRGEGAVCGKLPARTATSFLSASSNGWKHRFDRTFDFLVCPPRNQHMLSRVAVTAHRWDTLQPAQCSRESLLTHERHG